MTTFIDTNVLFAILNDQEPHHEWAKAEIATCKTRGPVLVCDVVYAEFSIGMATVADVNATIERLDLERYQWDDQCLFDAGKAFKAYRDANRGKPKDRVLPDFLIGALAATKGVPLMTANVKDFATHFPGITFITP